MRARWVAQFGQGLGFDLADAFAAKSEVLAHLFDIALGALPFEERSVARASAWQIDEGRQIKTCSAEDLVVHKVFAGRDRDWDDVRGVLTLQSRPHFKHCSEEGQPASGPRHSPRATSRTTRPRLVSMRVLLGTGYHHLPALDAATCWVRPRRNEGDHKRDTGPDHWRG